MTEGRWFLAVSKSADSFVQFWVPLLQLSNYQKFLLCIKIIISIVSYIFLSDLPFGYTYFQTSEQAISEFEVVEAEWRQRRKMMRRYFLLDLMLDIKHAKFYGVRPNDSWSHIFINVDIHKRRQNFFGHFWYPLPHVRILTLVYLTSTF